MTAALWASFRCDTCGELILEERITDAVLEHWAGVSWWWLGQLASHMARHHGGAIPPFAKPPSPPTS